MKTIPEKIIENWTFELPDTTPQISKINFLCAIWGPSKDIRDKIDRI